jgi:hypothetical protein
MGGYDCDDAEAHVGVDAIIRTMRKTIKYVQGDGRSCGQTGIHIIPGVTVILNEHDDINPIISHATYVMI